MKTINVKDYIKQAVNTAEARILLDVIMIYEPEEIILDFYDIDKYNYDFFYHFYRTLAKTHGIYRVLEIKMINMTIDGRISYLAAMDPIERELK